MNFNIKMTVSGHRVGVLIDLPGKHRRHSGVYSTRLETGELLGSVAKKYNTDIKCKQICTQGGRGWRGWRSQSGSN